MSRVLKRLAVWILCLLLGAVFVKVYKDHRGYGEVSVSADPGVVYSTEEGNIRTTPGDTTKILEGVSYMENDSRCRLNIAYMDTGVRKPLLILVHGNAYLTGSRNDLNPLVYTYAEKGYVVATVDYGVLPQTSVMEQQRNLMTAAEYLAVHAKEYDININRVMLLGESSGAQLAVRMAEEVASNVDNYMYHIVGVIAVSGMTDFLKYRSVGTDPEFLSLFDHPERIATSGTVSETADDTAPSAEGVTQNAVVLEEELARIDPTINVTSDLPPILIMHGAEDGVVPLPVARSFYDALQAARVTSSLVIISGMGHELSFTKLVPYLDIFLVKYM